MRPTSVLFVLLFLLLAGGCAPAATNFEVPPPPFELELGPRNPLCCCRGTTNFVIVTVRNFGATISPPAVLEVQFPSGVRTAAVPSLPPGGAITLFVEGECPDCPCTVEVRLTNGKLKEQRRVLVTAIVTCT